MNWFRVENITEVMTPFPTRVLEDGVIPLRFTLNFEKLTYIPQLTFHVQSRGFSELVKEYPIASDGAASAHHIKFIYSEKATKFCEPSTLLMTGTTLDNIKVEISDNFVAFSEYMNFNF